MRQCAAILPPVSIKRSPWNEVQQLMFRLIKEGDVIRADTRTGIYVDRAKA